MEFFTVRGQPVLNHDDQRALTKYLDLALPAHAAGVALRELNEDRIRINKQLRAQLDFIRDPHASKRRELEGGRSRGPYEASEDFGPVAIPTDPFNQVPHEVREKFFNDKAERDRQTADRNWIDAHRVADILKLKLERIDAELAAKREVHNGLLASANAVREHLLKSGRFTDDQLA